MTGRPSKYTDEIAAAICRELASGRSLVSICDDDDMPSRTTVMTWQRENEAFRTLIARAREDQAETMADDMLGIADDSSLPVDERKLKIWARQWLAGKLKPKKYGDKLALGGADDLPPMKSQNEVTLAPSDAYRRMVDGEAK